MALLHRFQDPVAFYMVSRQGGGMAESQDILDFWFDEIEEKKWFEKDPAFDADLRSRFGTLHADAMAGRLESWAETPGGMLALIIVLDQFSRNLFRDDPRAFAGDPAGLALCERMLDLGWDKALSPKQRVFAYLPLEHAEDLAAQERVVPLMADTGLPDVEMYADKHRQVIARFGRFPHRNAVLGRESTPEEIEFLKQPGSSF